MSKRRQAGFTLLELMTAVAIIALLTGLSAPSIMRWVEKQRFKDAGRNAAGLISYARGQALRTGDVFIVFFDTDAQGAALMDSGGNPVPVLVLNDGIPGSANQNCKIDVGEETRTVRATNGVMWGMANATGKAPSDAGTGDPASGWTFIDPDTAAASWLLFRPEGTPFSFAPDCDIGDVGSGAGGIYFTDGDDDQSIIVTPLGAVRVHTWVNNLSAWSS